MTVQLGGASLSTLSWTCCSEVQRHPFECRRAVDIPSPLQECEHLLGRAGINWADKLPVPAARNWGRCTFVGSRCSFCTALKWAWLIESSDITFSRSHLLKNSPTLPMPSRDYFVSGGNGPSDITDSRYNLAQGSTRWALGEVPMFAVRCMLIH